MLLAVSPRKYSTIQHNTMFFKVKSGSREGYHVQGRLARSAFCSWQKYVQTDCAHMEDVAAQAAQRVARQQRASAFSAWLGLHHQCQDDLKSITFCRRCSSCALTESSLTALHLTNPVNDSGRWPCLSADAVWAVSKVLL